MEVFYHLNVISNILSIADVADKYIFAMDTGNEKAMNFHVGEDKFLIGRYFRKSFDIWKLLM